MKTVLTLITALLLAAFSTYAAPMGKPSTPKDQSTVVLLHGLTRTSRAMDKMASELRQEGYRIINHDYDSRSAPIDQLSRQIFTELRPQLTEAATVHFVTHSMGGILLWNHLQTNTLDNLGRVVMLAPPSQGSEVTDKLGHNIIYNWINGPAGDQLGTDTNSIPLALNTPTFELGIIAGDRTVNPILSMLIPGPDDGKVSVKRSKTEGMADHICLHATHTFIMRNRTAIAQTKHFLKTGTFKHHE